MADYKRTEVPEDVILHISPSRNTVVVQEHSANGVVSYREIDPIEFYFALNGSYTTNDYLDSGFLPEHCLHIAMNAAERRYVIWNPELRADVIYRDTEYLDFPLPRLVFSLRVLADGRVADCSMGVVADEPPTEDSREGTGRHERQQYADQSGNAREKADLCLCPRGTSRADAGYAALSCEAHDPQAGYRGVLCTGVL